MRQYTREVWCPKPGCKERFTVSGTKDELKSLQKKKMRQLGWTNKGCKEHSR